MLSYSVLLYNYHLNKIEEKLQNGSSVLDTNDVKFMKDIIQCFHRILKCKKMYPKLNALLDGETFQSIFNDMSPNFSGINEEFNEMSPNFSGINKEFNDMSPNFSDINEDYNDMSPNFSGINEEFNIVCEYCDMKIPLLNNDLAFAYQMHQQTPKHIEVVNTFREFQSLSTSNATLDNGQQDCVAECCSVVSIDSGYVDNQNKGGVDAHQCTSLKKNHSNSKNSIRKSMENVSSIEDIYRSRCKIRLTYFMNKICIFSRFDNNQQYYRCGLCNVDMIDETHVKMHILESTHRTRVGKKCKCDSKRARFEPCIFTPTKNEHIIDRHLICHLCMTNLRSNRYNSDEYLLHLRSKDHVEKVKAHFQLPIFKDWERGIVFRDGNPYCVYCNLVLPSLYLMKKHVREPTHLNFAIQ